MDVQLAAEGVSKIDHHASHTRLDHDVPQQLTGPTSSLESGHEPAQKHVDPEHSPPETQHTSSESGHDLAVPPGSTSAVVSVHTFDVDDLPVLANHDREQRRLQALNYAACCWTMVLSGWNDGSLGPLLPTMQSYYKVNYAVVSLVFVANCVGYISGAISNVTLTRRFGFGKLILAGAFLQTVSFVLQAPAGPFPLLIVSYLIDGAGMSLQQAQANTYVGSLDDRSKMGILHACYGLGALCAPLLATWFAPQRHWSFHYIASSGLGVTNMIVLLAVFRLRTLNETLVGAGLKPNETRSQSGQDSRYGQIMSIKVVQLCALWALVYVGVEFTIGGWIVTYIQNERGGGKTTGYISTGFFAGLALGRVLLLRVNRWLGETRAMFLYLFGVVVLQVTVWFVPSLIENAVAVAAIGLLLGPMYPMLMSHITAVLPRWVLSGSLAWVSGVGTAGSAALPFLTGLISSKYGIRSLQPFLISMMGLLIGVWTVVPKGHTRLE